MVERAALLIDEPEQSRAPPARFSSPPDGKRFSGRRAVVAPGFRFARLGVW